jgi:DNA primase
MLSVDVIQILDHYEINYEEKNNSDELYFLCPFHHDKNFGSALFNTTSTEWNCFSCKEGGNIFKFVMKMENCDYWTAKKLVESDFNDKTYDLKKLENKFERAEKRLQRPSKNIKTATTIVYKFLDAFSQRNPSIEFIEKWYKICVYILYLNDQNDKDFDKKCLQYYSQFFSELNQENPCQTQIIQPLISAP